MVCWSEIIKGTVRENNISLISSVLFDQSSKLPLQQPCSWEQQDKLSLCVWKGSMSEAMKHSGQVRKCSKYKWAFLGLHQLVQAPSGPMHVSSFTGKEAFCGTWHGKLGALSITIWVCNFWQVILAALVWGETPVSSNHDLPSSSPTILQAVRSVLIMFFCRISGQAGSALGKDGERQCLTNRVIKFSRETWTTAPRRHSLPTGRCIVERLKPKCTKFRMAKCLAPSKTATIPNQPWHVI